MSAELEFNEEISRLVEAVYLTPDVAATRHAVLRALELMTAWVQGGSA
jgi:hypothetical protein